MYWMNPNCYLFLFVIDDSDRKYVVNKRMQLQVWYSITAFTIQMWYFCACTVIEFGPQPKRLIQKPLAKLFAPASLSCRHGIQYVSVPYRTFAYHSHIQRLRIDRYTGPAFFCIVWPQIPLHHSLKDTKAVNKHFNVRGVLRRNLRCGHCTTRSSFYRSVWNSMDSYKWRENTPKRGISFI